MGRELLVVAQETFPLATGAILELQLMTKSFQSYCAPECVGTLVRAKHVVSYLKPSLEPA
jgi:hypothetical protein